MTSYVSRRLIVGEDQLREPVPDLDAPGLGSVVALLAEPGGGKSAFAKALSDVCNARKFSATGFVSWGPADEEAPGNKLFIIDGLDEIAGKRWGDGVDKVLTRLHELGCPKALLTCRTAEWEGARNKSLLRELYSEDPVEVRFAPFSFEELVKLVGSFDPDVSAREFLDEAQRRDLGDMLSNPESLRLLLTSVKGEDWPKTRTELFERACEHGVLETNERLKTSDRFGNEDLIKISGEICASILLAGLDGVDKVRENLPGFQHLQEFGDSDVALRKAAVGTRLFRSHGGTCLVPAHRMLAEFLGARWLAARLGDQQVSARRVNAVVAPDGYVRTDLRGLHAWLVTLGSGEIRRQGIDRDPYGVLRYGDPEGFSVPEKRRLLERLRVLAEDDPYFRAAEGWTRPMIAGFFDESMRTDVMAILTDCKRKYHLSTLLLDAMRGSEFTKSLAPDLLCIAEDEDRPYGERSGAVEALYHLPEIDWPALVQRLRLRRAENSARLSLEIIACREGGGLDPVLTADTIADAMLLHTDDRDADLSTRDVYAVKQLPAPSLGPVLDRMSERMAFMCDGRLRYDCNCTRAISPTVFRLLERRFGDCEVRPTADEVWRWIRKTCLAQNLTRETKTISEALESDDSLRRGIQARALRATEFEDDAWMAQWRLSDTLDGLRITPADAAHHMDDAVAEGLSEKNIELWSHLARSREKEDAVIAAAERHLASHPTLTPTWEDITRPRKPSYRELRRMARKRKHDSEAEKDRRERYEAFAKVHEQVESGSHSGRLYQISRAYLNHFSDIKGETPEERLADLVGEAGVASAIRGLCAALRRDDLPTVEMIAEVAIQGKYLKYEAVLCAGVLAHAKSRESIQDIPLAVLQAARASGLFSEAFGEDETSRNAVEERVFATSQLIEQFARRLFEPQLAVGSDYIRDIHLLTSNKRFFSCAGRLGLEWLAKFPTLELSIQRRLIEAAIMFGDRGATVRLVAGRCASRCESKQDGALEDAGSDERSLWITAAFLIDYQAHLPIISAYAQEGRCRLWPFRDIIEPSVARHRDEAAATWPRLGIPQNQFLIEVFGPSWPRAELENGGWKGETSQWNAHEFLTGCAQAISDSDDPSAGAVLSELIANPDLSEYHEQLRHLRASWRRRQRDAELNVPSFAAVREIYTDGQPKSVSDLSAVMMDTLQWLQEDVRDGDTRGWSTFWDADGPRNENDCRDHILDRIRLKFEPLTVRLRPECRMPDDKRADIVVSLVLDGETYDLPVEVKGQWHEEVWTAAATQLDERYTRYVNARGRGVYLVLWFGPVSGRNLPKRKDGASGPETPEELERMLIGDLSEELRNRIEVFVLDVSRPSA